MASIVWIFWLGVLLGSCSAGQRCPTPCLCPPATLVCQGCPKEYLILANDTQLLSVNGCKNIEYLLKLHSSHLGNEQSKYSLHKLEITDSFMDKIPESYISNEYPIQSLNFSNNLIESIEPGLEAYNLTHLDLSHNRLSFIGNRTFYRMNNLLYLDVSFNSISNLSGDSFFGLEKLAHLDISNNKLTFLTDALFVPITSLQQLNLSYNMLEVLSEKCFGSLMLLQQLDISYNRLTNVAPGTLQFLPNLAKLLLADNPRLKPDAQIFVGTGRRLQQVDASRTGLRRVPEALTHSVRYLSLAGNRISTIRCGDLDGYPLLHMLDFSENIIEYIEDDALGRLEMISRLYLEKNRLPNVPKMLPEKLNYLSMEHNIIQNLTITDFTTLTNLKELILSNNLISYIQENAFSQLVSLEVLDISSNPLKTLTPTTFGGPMYLKVLKICNVSTSPPATDISFPVPFPERMEQLHLRNSPGLMREFLADTAALAAMARLQYLDLSYTNISNIRSDLLYFLPQIRHLKLEGNKINCSGLTWLTEWMKESVDEYKNLTCSSPKNLTGQKLVDLPSPIKVSEHINQNEKMSADLSKQMIIKNTNKKLLDLFSTSKQNITNDDVLKKLLNNTNTAKTLLDLQNYDQYHINFKFPRKIINKSDVSDEYNKSDNHSGLNETSPSQKHEKYMSGTLLTENEYQENKINNNFLTNSTSANTTNNNKLIQIFSQLSHTDKHSDMNNTANKTKNNITTDASVPLCNVNGNLNGTENKTKCSSLPEKSSQFSQAYENTNIKLQEPIYRKNINEKSNGNSNMKNLKYVSVPKEFIAVSSIKNVRHTDDNSMGEITKTTHNPIDISKKFEENVITSKIVDEDKKKIRDISKKTNTKEEPMNWKDYILEKQYIQMKIWNVSQLNNTIAQLKSMKKEMLLEAVENVSHHQTLEFKSVENTHVTYVGIAVVIVAFVGTATVLIIVFLTRRRSLGTGSRSSDIMEVQAISAVGELW